MAHQRSGQREREEREKERKRREEEPMPQLLPLGATMVLPLPKNCLLNLLIFGVQNAFETVEAVWSCTCVRRQREREEREKERLKQREEKDRKLEWQQSFGATLLVKHIKHIKPKTRCP